MRSSEGAVQVCPSAVTKCIPVPTESVSGCRTPYEAAGVPRRELSLSETVQLAVGNAKVVRNLGLVDANSHINIVRGDTTQFDRGIASAEADAAWGIFDPVLSTEVFWERDDLPPGVSFNGIGNRPSLLDDAMFSAGVSQRNLTGGELFVGLDTDYLFNPQAPVGLNPNPQYFSRLDFGYEQPLLRGSGVDVNLSGIRIACAKAGKSVWTFKREMLALVRSVESAAWSLYAAEHNLAAVEEVIPLFDEVLRTKSEMADRGVGAEGDVSKAASDLLKYRQERFEILSEIAEQQLVLRNLLGLDPCDGAYLQLDLQPQMALPPEDAQQSLQTAMVQRPDVLSKKLDIYIASQERVQAKDSLRPELDAQALWRLNGLGDDVGSSLDQLAEGNYETWQLGVAFKMPLGRREGWGNVRAAELTIHREYALLEQVAHQAAMEIADAHRQLKWIAEQHEVAVERVEALRAWRDSARAKVENPPAGMGYDLALEIYVRNLNSYVQASQKANELVASYNSSLARLDEVRGTLLTNRLIFVEGDPTEEIAEKLEQVEVQ